MGIGSVLVSVVILVTGIPRRIWFSFVCRITVTRGGAVIAGGTPSATVSVIASRCGVSLIVSRLGGFVGIVVCFVVIWRGSVIAIYICPVFLSVTFYFV